MRSVLLDIVRVTEAGAIAASDFIGSGKKEEADKAATDEMRQRLNQIEFIGDIKIGEGKKDNSYGLYHGERVGSPIINPQKYPVDMLFANYDIAIDPIDGTRSTAESKPGAISVMALSGKDCMYHTEAHYMTKLACGYRLKDHLSLECSLEQNVRLACGILNKRPQDLMVCTLNRPRHVEIIEYLRKNGVGIKLIDDGDVEGVIASCGWDAGIADTGVDFFFGVGGAPEAVIAAAAVKALNGNMECAEWNPYDKSEFSLKSTPKKILKLDDLIKGHCGFVATGITDGAMLKGVRKSTKGPKTNSIVMSSRSGTVRLINTNHKR